MPHLTLAVPAMAVLGACSGASPSSGDTAVCTESTWYADVDADGYGAGPAVTSCSAPAGHVAVPGDCDDGDAMVHPGADELCNDVDDDCDGDVDGPSALDPSTCYLDEDGDGYGRPDVFYETCNCADLYSLDAGDCDDGEATVHPGATEVWYDGIDQDCDDWSDADADRDGHDATSAGGDDCNDQDAAIHPDQDEVCGNGVDDDCDGLPADCGLSGWVSSDHATLDVYGGGEWSGLTVGGPTDDLDGDGSPEVLLAHWGNPHYEGDDGSSKADILEFHLVSAAGGGAQELSAVSIASFIAPTRAGHWETNWPGGVTDTDLDGDGHADYLLGAGNLNWDDLGSPGRIYLEYGPATGVATLSVASAVTAPTAELAIGRAPFALTSSDGAGHFVLAAPVGVNLPGTTRQVVLFLDETHFGGSRSAADAPALWFDADEELVFTRFDDVGDVDGDGVADMLLTRQSSASVYQRTPMLFLGPLDADITTGDADLLFMDEHRPRTMDSGAVICPAGDGGRYVVVTRIDYDEGGSLLSMRYDFHAWTGAGIQSMDDAISSWLDAGDSPGVSACGGDVNDDGIAEMLIEQESTSALAIDGSVPDGVMVDVPDAGVWLLEDDYTAVFFHPDSVTASFGDAATLGSDFDGDGFDDVIYSLRTGGDDRGWLQVLRFDGGPTGL
ncbi:MAG: hypothetical protein D6798_11420 [Deltaproteobacteria bacterium]|nr:MAG: hypothetical protein D6798_11420 [Deltaproteobacteria bacterium]